MDVVTGMTLKPQHTTIIFTPRFFLPYGYMVGFDVQVKSPQRMPYRGNGMVLPIMSGKGGLLFEQTNKYLGYWEKAPGKQLYASLEIASSTASSDLQSFLEAVSVHLSLN
jgi:hypothetical protein